MLQTHSHCFSNDKSNIRCRCCSGNSSSSLNIKIKLVVGDGSELEGAGSFDEDDIVVEIGSCGRGHVDQVDVCGVVDGGGLVVLC